MTSHDLFGDPDDELTLLGGTDGPRDFRALAPAAHGRELDDLATWIDWLVHRYDLDPREVPPCWADHGALLEELSALQMAHEGAYDARAPLDAPAAWHHTLDAVRRRCREWTARTGCRPGAHRHSG